MKGIDEIFPLIIGAIIAVVLFFALTSTIAKSLKRPQKRDTIDSRMKIKEQKWHMDDVRRRQKQLLRDQKQKIRDLQRR